MTKSLKPMPTLAGLAMLLALPATSQNNQPLLTENTTRVSDHVHVIMGFPNVVIVVGSRATLVVDTGLGPRNGATIVRAANKLSSNSKLFLTTTHFHPEHAGGEQGFPAGTILIRDAAQQQEMEQHGMEMVELFRKRSAQNAQLLANSSCERRIFFSTTNRGSISVASPRG